MPENIPKYECEYCNFKCSKQSNYKMHLSTDKHIRLTMANDANQNNATVFICTCGEKYMHRSSLSRHKKKCTFEKIEPIIQENNKCIPQTQHTDNPDLYAIINVLIKENQEIRNAMITQTNTLVGQNTALLNQNNTLVEQNKALSDFVKNQQPTMTNSNNTTNSHNNYNINMFLTDKCKDAQNMSDFIEVLKNKVDMFMIEEKGYVDGISKLFIQELNSMEITERPLHCTDERRNTFYVHNNDTWNKDENLKDTKKAINHVSHANLQQCLAWSKNVPDGGSDREEHITRSIRLCKEANKSSDDDKVDKIIRNISKEIPLNKQVISDVLIE